MISPYRKPAENPNESLKKRLLEAREQIRQADRAQMSERLNSFSTSKKSEGHLLSALSALFDVMSDLVNAPSSPVEEQGSAEALLAIALRQCDSEGYCVCRMSDEWMRKASAITRTPIPSEAHHPQVLESIFRHFGAVLAGTPFLPPDP